MGVLLLSPPRPIVAAVRPDPLPIAWGFCGPDHFNAVASLPCRLPLLHMPERPHSAGTDAVNNTSEPIPLEPIRPRGLLAQVDRPVCLHWDLNALAGLVGLCRGHFQPDLCGLDLCLGRPPGFL